jgi:hypothetical protein
LFTSLRSDALRAIGDHEGALDERLRRGTQTPLPRRGRMDDGRDECGSETAEETAAPPSECIFEL